MNGFPVFVAGAKGLFGLFEAYFQEKAFLKAQSHFKRGAECGLEALGFLVGRVFSHEGKNYVVVEDYLTAENNATAVSVRFSDEAFSSLSRGLKQRKGMILVGWAHSHPSYGCFLSSTDVRTQKVFFQEDFHVALVCDPMRPECKAFKVSRGRTREASFAVIKKK